MKQKLKRFMAGFLAVLTMLTSLLSSGVTASAASASANIKFWYASAKDHGVISEYNSSHTGKILYAMIDGHSAYCMNYGLSAKGGQLMTSSDNSSTSMSDSQEKLLAYCMYYGFSTTDESEPDNTKKNQFIATQAMVWNIVAGIYGTDSGDSAASQLCDCAPDPTSSYQYYTALKGKINASYNAVRPSFASKSKSSAKTYELKWNETKERYEYDFHDKNGVLPDFKFSISGFEVEKSGNDMTIYTKTAQTKATTGTFKSTSGAVDTTTSCVFWVTGESGYQEFVSEQPSADPISAYIKVKTENSGYGELTKTDSSSGVKLAGAVYGIYSDSECTKKVDTMTTDANGYAKSKALEAGTYYVKEITAPKGYVLSDKVHTLTVTVGKTTGITADDVEQLGSLTIYKEGEVLSGWDGINFTYETGKLPGASFKVTAGEDINKADGTKVYSKGDVVAAELVTGADGQAVLTDLHLGTYVVTETKGIDGYAINTTPQTVKIEYKDQNVTVQAESATVLNERQKAVVGIAKADSETGALLAGGEFTLYAGSDIKNPAGTVVVAKDTALQTVATGADGRAVFTVDLPVGNDYYVAETKAPEQYFRNSEDVYGFTFNAGSQDLQNISFEHSFQDKRVTGKIKIHKVDKETKQAVPQGDASLEGALYELHAREDIVHPDGTTGIVYHAGDLVASAATDANGEAVFENLYLGKYYVKEVQASEGYLLDEEEHDVSCEYEGDTVAEVLRETISEEQVKKQPFQLIKVSDNGEETEAPLLAGAGFSAYLKSALPVNEGGSYDFTNAVPVVIGEGGATTIYTDSKGYARSIAIPYGTYVVLETVTPHNMETIKPFEVRITENLPAEPQTWRVFLDREFSAKLRIVKKDADTKQTVLIPNAEFKIFSLDTGKYVSMTTTYPSKVTHTSFFTDGDGDLILPQALKVGNYRIEEISAPTGYVVNEAFVTVAVDSDTAYAVDPDTYEAIITVDYEDAPAVGELTVEKKGEVLDSYKGGLFADAEEKTFVYREGSLAGAKFEVYAAEDIYTADMQKDESGNRTKYYAEGELVATLITGEDGKASAKNLPLGQYRVVEVEAPFGYVLNTSEQYVTFTYVDDHTPVIYESVEFFNERQKLALTITKKDAETELPISGAVFGLYAGEDIRNVDGEVIVPEGTFLEKAVSGADGVVAFTKDYPFGEYYAKELEAPKGYVTNGDMVVFDARYQGQDTAVAKYDSIFTNAPTTFEFSKEDITSGAELSGATLSVIDKNGAVVETWTSKAGEKHTIKKLLVGEEYVLREEYAPYGYLKAVDVAFTVLDTETIQSVVMKDEVPTGSIIINKDGEFVTNKDLIKGHWYDFIINYFRKSLAGVTFEVYAKDDIVSPDGLDTVYYKADELVDTIVTNDKGIASLDSLPLGRYYLVETQTLDGFVLDGTPILADLSYVDQNTAIVYAGMDVTNERQKVQVTVVKKDAETKKPLEGAVFGIFAKEAVVNSEGETVIEADERIERAVTGSDGSVVFVTDLPLGQYYVKELEAPKGYVKSDETFDVDASYQGDSVKVIEFTAEFENKPTKVEISKTDITGEKELAGAKLSIIDADGNTVESWTSEAGKTHLIERLPVGKYILREVTAPYGYRIANDVEFEVTETAEIQKVAMKDEFVVGKIVIDKTDADTKKAIAGVEFEIRDKDGKVLETLVTDKKGHAESMELPVCTYKDDGSFKEDIHYFVVETKAAKGYILDETVHEVVLSYEEKAPECVTYTLALTNKPTEPKLPQTGDEFNPWAWAGIGLVLLVAGIIVSVYKRDGDEEDEAA